MVVDQPASNVDLALLHARAIRELRSGNPKLAIDSILGEELTNGFQSVYFPPTANTVGVYYGGDNGRKVMYLDGILTTSQAADLIAGYQRFGGLQIIQRYNLWIEANMPFYFSCMTGNHLQAPEYLDLVGFSGGGAIASCMAAELVRRNNRQKKKLITFGAPRPGGELVRDGLARFPVARWMTPADPIPLVPPRLQDAPQFAAIVPSGILISWSNMVHTPGGIVVYSDGSTEERVHPPEAQVTPGTSLATWLFSQDGEPNNPHGINTYITYLTAATERFPQPREKTRDVGPGEVKADATKRGINARADRVVSALAAAQAEQGTVIANEPAIVLFRPIRLGRIWTVQFGDQIVAQGVREDTCRHICRAGNDFLRSLPKQALVDPVCLLEQFENFLAFAIAPESEWLPKINTSVNLN